MLSATETVKSPSRRNAGIGRTIIRTIPTIPSGTRSSARLREAKVRAAVATPVP
jgi:hypothetical protein